MTLRPRCRLPASPHVLRCQRLHWKKNAAGTRFHCGTVKQTHTTLSHNQPLNLSEIFQREHKGKEAAAPPVTSFSLCNYYWLCMRRRPLFSPNTERPGRLYREELKWLREQPWKLHVNPWLSRRHVWCILRALHEVEFLQAKEKLDEIRADIFKLLPVLQVWSKVSKSRTQVLLSGCWLKFNSDMN